jgi:hypothetical protein
MKAFVAAVVVAVVMAAGAAYVLDTRVQTSSADAFRTDGARPDPERARRAWN